jgi:hypothetical protein
MAPKAKRKGVSFVSPGKNAEDPPLALTGLTQLPTPALLEAIRGAADDSGAPGPAQFSASQDVGPTQVEPSTLLPSLDVAVTDDDDETDLDEARGSASEAARGTDHTVNHAGFARRCYDSQRRGRCGRRRRRGDAARGRRRSGATHASGHHTGRCGPSESPVPSSGIVVRAVRVALPVCVR